MSAVNGPTEDWPPLRRVAVVGTGLIGGSLARALQAHADLDGVAVHDADAAVRRRARELGVGTRVADTLEDAVAGADLVVLAVPMAAIAETAAATARAADGPLLLTDVGSVKSRLVAEVRRLLPDTIQYIGGHPMTGSEDSGLEAADAALFQGAAYVLTPDGEVAPGAFNRLAALLRAVGARVLAVDPAVHDRLVAVVSHLPQLLASTLMTRAADEAESSAGVLAVAAGGFRDVTRVAASDPDLWVSILRENRSAVLAELAEFSQRLDTLRAAVEAGDWRAVHADLARARSARRSLPGKPTVRELVDVVVALEDEPGTLAAVTTTLGQAGINIEDLSLRHASEGGRGALVVAIDGRDDAERARDRLATKGYHAHVEPR